ncbi:hypothetical protein ACJJTC_018531 [Scirpophaga incertulas]
MYYYLLILQLARFVEPQLLDQNSYNSNYPQHQTDVNNNASLYRPNSQAPYGSFAVNANEYNQPQSPFYQSPDFGSNNYDDNNEVDSQSVSPEEHGFIITNLMKLDPQKGSWYISGHQQSQGYWTNDVDGSQLTGLENAFFDDRQLTYTSYKYTAS